MSIFGGRKDKKTAPQTGETKPLTAPKLSTRQPVGFETVLGTNATLKGDLKSQANVRLDGTFEGTLEIDGNVLVGETAKITADIHAKNVSIAGAVRGDVSGIKVQLLRTGRVWGNITASAIATEEGAFIDGKITMISHDASETFDPNALPLPDEFQAGEPATTSSEPGSSESAQEEEQAMPSEDEKEEAATPATDGDNSDDPESDESHHEDRQ